MWDVKVHRDIILKKNSSSPHEWLKKVDIRHVLLKRIDLYSVVFLKMQSDFIELLIILRGHDRIDVRMFTL